MGETIVGWHAVYEVENVTLLGEVYRIEHRLPSAQFNHAGWYAVARVGRGPWRPYLGVDGVHLAAGDSFYAAIDNRTERYMAGLSFDLTAFNVLRTELRHDVHLRQKDNSVAIQTAFMF